MTLGIVKGAVIVQETHEDGGYHLHALVEYMQKRNIKNERAFDATDDDGNIYHPNIETVRNVIKAKNYLSKEDETPLLYGDVEGWTIKEVKDYVSEIRELEPNDRINYAIKNKIQKWQWDMIFSKRDDLTITEDPALGTVYDPNFLDAKHVPNKCLILQGNTGAGKTTTAKALGPYPMLWCTHIDDLKHFVSGFHQCILFDDMSFKHMPRGQQINLLDITDARTIHVRYSCVTIPAGIPRIFTCNYGEFPFEQADPALARRWHLIAGDPDFVFAD